MFIRDFTKTFPLLRAVLKGGLLLLLSIGADAEHLPIKTYTTADGLLRDAVSRIKQDSRGFLWLCTAGGLSRFDGYRFTNYTMSDGLPTPSVTDLVEASDGTIWIATPNGLVRFNPQGTRALYSSQANQNSHLMFEVVAPGSDKLDRDINVLLADEQGLVWVGTATGLYRMQVKDGRPQFEKTAISYSTTSLIKDHRGGLWAGTFFDGLDRLSPDGTTILQHFTSDEGLPRVYGQRSATIESLLEDKAGNLWVGFRSAAGICELALNVEANRYVVLAGYDKRDGLSNTWIFSMLQASDGSLWVGTNGLYRVVGNGRATKLSFQSFTAAQGFCDDAIYVMVEDRDGNFWLGTSCGLKKWTRSGFTSYDTKDALSSLKVSSFLETLDGAMIITDLKDGRTLNLFSEGKFKAIRPNYPSEIGYWGWGWRQTVLQTHDGEWWITVGMSDEYKRRFKEMPPDGPLVVRFPKVKKLEDLARIKPKSVYRPRDGLLGYDTFRLYEDRNGDVWMVTLDHTRLFKWERQTEKFHELTEAADLGDTGYIYVFREDRAGNLWMGAGISFRHDPNQTFSLMRYQDGHFSWFTTADGLPEGTVRDLLIDGVGRLWIATSRGGVLRVDDTTAERPHFTAYTTAQGLSDNTTSSLTEDRFGRIYIGSGRGVDRLDPATGVVKHFTTADGLPREEIQLAYRDRTGVLWFGSNQGLARYEPESEHARPPPNILVMGLQVSNVAQPVSALGETELPGFEFDPAQNNLSVDFLGLGADLGEELRYQYKLEGADADWVATAQRTVNFSNLAPGAYRFLVKAITAEGLESANSASFTFTILPPIWRRWWFMALAAAAIGLIGYTAYRYRISQLIKLERVRLTLASDLHDDIGANLSLIAGLSDMLKQQAQRREPQMTEKLSLIASVSRLSVDAMSDIVWAVNPNKDYVRDLTQRMRRFAGDTFTARNIKFHFNAPEAQQDAKLKAEARREIFLIFKEAINNIARHSGCTEAEVVLEIERGLIVLRVSDNGKGFEPSRTDGGQGFANMRRRAEKLGGELQVTANPGLGSTVLLSVPFK